jgi:hypothetical protein
MLRLARLLNLALVLAGLALGIMALDMPINWYWNWSRMTGQQGRLLVTAPWLIMIFGLFVFATAPVLLRLMRPAVVEQRGA